MVFEWDENKNKTNIHKHGIPFDYAIQVFEDENRIEQYDELHSDGEDRYDVIGMVDDILFVVCMFKADDVVRIISARKATKKKGGVMNGND